MIVRVVAERKTINISTIAKPIRNPISCVRSLSGLPKRPRGVEHKVPAIQQRDRE